MNEMVPVTGTAFVRDIKSMCLSNTNQNEKEEYYSKRRMMANQTQQINSVRSEVAELREQMGEIRTLLIKLLEKNNG